MMKLSKNMHEMDETVKLKLSPVCCLPSALNIERVEPQLSVERPEACLVGGDKGEAMAVAKVHAPKPGFGALKMQTSDVCHKNFVIFDQCEGQNTVILHPSLLQGLPHQASVEPGSMWEVNDFLDSLHVLNCKPIEAMFSFHSKAALSPAFGDVRGPALQGQQKSSDVQKCDLIVSCEAHNLKKQVLRTSTHLDDQQESLSSEFHENTEELNALLSSDVSSTSHSPSDGASYCSSETVNGPSTNTIGKKRKFEDSVLDEIDDADSGTVKHLPGHTPPNIGGLGNLDSPQSPVKSIYKSIQPGGLGNASGENTASSTLGIREQGNANQGQHEANQSSQMSAAGGLVVTSKRIKIKGNMQQLKNAIPGGNHLDTAGVLGRTIHYVKCLENKLRGLEAARESARATRQVG